VSIADTFLHLMGFSSSNNGQSCGSVS